MLQKIHEVKRVGYILVTFGISASISVPLFFINHVNAATITSRSIEMSSSTAAASGVSYQLTFTPVTTTQELIVDFCSDTPFIGSTCAFSAAGTPVTSSATASTGTISYPSASTHTVRVTGLTITGGSPFTITFGNVTNPTGTGSFYARVLTYATGNSSGYVPAASTGGATTTGTYVDAGGDALSTANIVTVTARVMETLIFCVSGSTITTCGTTTTPSITLGHGANTILDGSAVDTANIYTQTSTNAQNGVNVRLKNTSSTNCGGLSADNGATCGIPAVASGATTPITITAGTAAFGMCVTAGTANTTATAPYNQAGCTKYGLDDSSGTDVRTTYGSPMFSSTGPISGENDTLAFAATASNTTPAGIYTATYNAVATGTF